MEEKSTHTFHGGFEFEQLLLLRRRGKQREQNSKYTVNTILLIAGQHLHALVKKRTFLVDNKGKLARPEIKDLLRPNRLFL